MYSDIIAPRSEEEAKRMVERAKSLGYGILGVIGDVKVDSIKSFRVTLIGRIEPKLKGRLKEEADLLLARPKSLEDARKLTLSSAVDGVITTYDSEKPRVDYISLKQLKRNEGALVIPLKYLVRTISVNPQALRSVSLELRLATRSGVYPLICSFASEVNEQVPPRLMMSFAEFFFDLKREEAKRMVKDFPEYMLSKERKLKLKGREVPEVQGTDRP
ncbi:MAG: hypothetical protein NZ992_04780 [Candidatus Korarchaeum sp.]|nr:hypothetical protein [Candidatus Korarchaeum sp.]MDW8036138.1 hypothetical protein [Candidatus Korarchaeum sp.]